MKHNINTNITYVVRLAMPGRGHFPFGIRKARSGLVGATFVCTPALK